MSVKKFTSQSVRPVTVFSYADLDGTSFTFSPYTDSITAPERRALSSAKPTFVPSSTSWLNLVVGGGLRASVAAHS